MLVERSNISKKRSEPSGRVARRRIGSMAAGVHQCLGRRLRSCDVQSLQKKQMPVAAQVRKKGDESEGLMRRFVPMAYVGRGFPGLRMRIEDGRALHALAIDNAEVGVGLGNRGPRIAANRADDHSIGILQIVDPEIAWKTEENPLRVVFGQPGESGNRLEIDEAGELLRAQILGAVCIDSRKRQFQVTALNIVRQAPADGATDLQAD